ncbi:endothelial cell-selective adhesion molecule-like isoform X1 [Sinocyclocheilus rhinocerous]|uniref:endothelial cell-selective adhesion molecule-like isoform X1 n=1 Tax=Sinocyclocheilus rhinocerous TaxID=307959 RepID=UPI0007B9C420|nr:PREDICTED: endothelial cell-selective adhesion molecule-like isoform X1 [Sinocyclocheilus rhinocerous]
MEMLMDWRPPTFLLLTLLCLFPGDSQRVEMPRRDMEVIMGQMVVLEAWYTPTTSIEKNAVIWTFMANHSKQVISYFSGQIGIGSTDFRRRVGFAMTMPSANLSIYINNTQESDSGRYHCHVIIPGAPGLSGELHLNVKVPPSTPVCSMTGNPVLSGNVTLSCKSSYGKPVPQYKWTKAAPLSEVFFSPMQKWRSCPQPVLVLGYLDERQGTLRLSNLTKSMSGKYVCRASNTAGTDSCHINLEVSTPNNAWVIAGATVGSVVGLMALVLFLIFILRRNHDTEEEMANDIKEDAQAPKRVSWAKSGTGSDIVSKNGTLSSIATSPPAQEPQHPLQNNHYPYPPGASDTASILTTSGSTTTYRLCPGEPNPLHGLPGYNASGTANHTHRHHHHHDRHHTPAVLNPNSCSTQRTEGPQPQTPRPLNMPINSATLSRMGAVPIMVPTQNHAGSLV